MRTFPLASYSVLEPLRVGSLAQSHLAQRQGPDGPQRVVLKQLLPSFCDKEELIERWLRRAEQNAALSHPGCVRVLDWGRCNGEVYVAIEHVPGVGLKQLLRAVRAAHETLPIEVAVYIARATLDALACGHEQLPRLVHLDVSPYSLIVRPDGGLTLTEFGMWDALEPAEMARLRFDRGRVSYVSPEQAKSLPGDARSDVFSLGVLLHELLVGELPFSGGTQLVIAMAIAENKRRPLREIAPGLSDELCEVLEHLLAHKPDERFQSARAALNALTAVGPVNPSAARLLAQIATRTLETDKVSAPAPAAVGAFVSKRGPVVADVAAWATPAPLPRAPDERRTEQLNLSAMRAASVPAPAPDGPETKSPARSPSPLPPPPLSPAAFVGSPALPPDMRLSPVPPPMLASPGLTPPATPNLGSAPVAVPPFMPRSLGNGAAPLPPAPSSGPMAFANERPADLQRSPPPSEAALTSPPFGQPAPTPLVSAPFSAPLPSVAPLSAPVPAPASQGLGAFAPPRDDHERWHDPSKTLFQMKGYAKGATERGSSKTPLAVAVVLATIFGFAIVGGGYLLFRLLR